jgi:hypothetical protein
MLIESKAATPEEMRDDIVKYLKYQASIKRSQAIIADRKTTKSRFILQSEILEFVAKEIAAIVIKF